MNTTNLDIAKAIKNLVPNAAFSVCNEDLNTLVWTDTRPQPSLSEIQTELNLVIANKPFDDCKEKAKQLIAATDWSVLPDVGLQNKSEFEAYRAQLRALIVTPVSNPVWPTEPSPVWS